MGHGKFTEDEKMFYCTRTTYFPKTEVFRLILEIFDESGKNELRVRDIYVGLRKKLGTTSVNMSGLVRLLGGYGTLRREEVSTMSRANESGEPVRKSSEWRALLCLSPESLKRTLDVLGVDFIAGYLATDGVCFENFRRAMSRPGRPYAPVRRAEAPPFRKIFLEFMKETGEDALRELLGDIDALRRAYRAFSEEYGRRERIAEFLSEFGELAGQTDEANAGVSVRHLVPDEVSRVFDELGVATAGDLTRLEDSGAQRLFPHADAVLDLLKLLRTELSEALTDAFAGFLTMRNDKGVPHRLWERYAGMMELRMDGKTLEAAGQRYGLTRERVRQLEAMYFGAFNDAFGGAARLRGMLKNLSANEGYITPDEIRRVEGNRPDLFIHFLKNVAPEGIVYSEEAGLFAFTDGTDWLSELSATDLPDVLTEAETRKAASDAAERLRERGLDISGEICRKILLAGHRPCGVVYSRRHMSLGARYAVVLRECFPDGMHIYDKRELDSFRRCYERMFPDGKVSESDRAMISRIMDVGILCGRGRYRPRRERYVSDELVRDIYDYMMNSDKDIFVTNTLFAVFGDRLRAEGVNNKYQMQGILGECLRDKPLFFSRDYISKKREVTSVRDSLVEFIRKAGRTVTKEELRAEFPGISEVIIATACRNSTGIVNGFTTYTHRDSLLAKDRAVKALRELLDDLVSDGKIHGSRELVARIGKMEPFILEDLEIDNSYKMFGVMRMLYGDRYEARRPYFAAKGVRIGNQTARIGDFLSGFDEISIDSLMRFVNDCGFKYGSIMGIVDAQSGFFYKDRGTLVRAESAGLNEGMAEEIERFLDDRIGEDDFVVTTRITDWSSLPAVKAEWNGWLLYSAVRAWPGRYRTMMTSSILRETEPIVLRADLPVDTPEELADYEAERLDLIGFEKILWMEDVGLI